MSKTVFWLQLKSIAKCDLWGKEQVHILLLGLALELDDSSKR